MVFVEAYFTDKSNRLREIGDTQRRVLIPFSTSCFSCIVLQLLFPAKSADMLQHPI